MSKCSEKIKEKNKEKIKKKTRDFCTEMLQYFNHENRFVKYLILNDEPTVSRQW